jgi:hypothetical protein
VGRYRSIAVDHYGHPRIAHYDNSNGDLKLSWQAKTETIPVSGGTLQAFETATLEFPAGVFTDTVVMTTTLTQPFGTMPHVGVFYDLEAVYEGSGLPAEIQPGMTYTVTIHYDEAAVPPFVNEAELGLYYWDDNEWLLEPTSQVDVVNNVLSATPDHFSIWAGLFEDHRIYLPSITAQ